MILKSNVATFRNTARVYLSLQLSVKYEKHTLAKCILYKSNTQNSEIFRLKKKRRSGAYHFTILL